MALTHSDPRRLVMQYPRSFVAERGPVYGAWVVNDDFLSALLRHGTWGRYAFVVSEASNDGGSHDSNLRDLRREGIEITSVRDLEERNGHLGFAAWHVTSPNLAVPTYVRECRAERPFPITAVHHSISYQEYLHTRFLPLLLDELLPCDSIICTSAASRQSMQVLLDTVTERFNTRYGTSLAYRGRLDTIPLGVDTELLAPRDQHLARRALGLPTDPIILLWLGRVSAADKADLAPLLSAVADVSGYSAALGGVQARPIMLVIAGADPHGHAERLRAYAQALGIADQVRFFEHVDAHNKSAFYNAADIFIAPADNIQETFGLTPIEAMACGIPQVVADWDGYRDSVRDGETGLLVPTIWMDCDQDLVSDPQSWEDRTDHAALAQSVAVDPTRLRSGLLKLILNEDLRQTMGQASRVRAQALFSWREVIRRYEELWDELGAVADTTPSPAGRSAPSYREPFFFEAFRHYATRVVDADQRLAPSAAGREALRNDNDLAPSYSGRGSLLMRAALAALAERDCSIAELVDVLRTKSAAEPTALLRREILRLVKYGFAEFA